MENQVLAGVGHRLVAAFIDGMILIIVTIIIALISDSSTFSALSGNNVKLSDAVITLFVVVFIGIIKFNSIVTVAYFSYFESSERQATPGKIVMKIKVVDENGLRLSLGNAIGRSLSKIISGAFCMIGFIMAFFTQDEQALHDRIAKTYVVGA